MAICSTGGAHTCIPDDDRSGVGREQLEQHFGAVAIVELTCQIDEEAERLTPAPVVRNKRERIARELFVQRSPLIATIRFDVCPCEPCPHARERRELCRRLDLTR